MSERKAEGGQWTLRCCGKRPYRSVRPEEPKEAESAERAGNARGPESYRTRKRVPPPPHGKKFRVEFVEKYGSAHKTTKHGGGGVCAIFFVRLLPY